MVVRRCKINDFVGFMVRQERFELTTCWFEDRILLPFGNIALSMGVCFVGDRWVTQSTGSIEIGGEL
jgi:hypothetical protein